MKNIAQRLYRMFFQGNGSEQNPSSDIQYTGDATKYQPPKTSNNNRTNDKIVGRQIGLPTVESFGYPREYLEK